MKQLLIVFIGGGLGSVVRFLISKIKFRIRLDQLILYMFKITGYFHSLIGSKGI